MSISNVNERSSAIHVGLPWRGLFPVPDAQLNGNDRAHIATFFGAHLSPLLTSTGTLQKPVDYALAGEQDEEGGKWRVAGVFRPGRAGGRNLRRVFGE